MSLKVLIYAYRKPAQLYCPQHVEVSPEGATTRNATTPATVIVGQQSDYDFDAYAELTFVDQAAFQAFGAKIYAPEAATQIPADEERLDKSQLAIAMLGDGTEMIK
ncbi:uncharacterized protein N7498_009980 [Penicillium cinerascens]|uniref:EthD domain-containing protein n=1 Tax=Penicillium cinerascens TaxID=70096 RepID=A0A9W9J9X5_9EURO|nr:uncharacterized protein N7498_009980 [Penicillium cinerascens]KAJ5190995.1 hypothetical protein N7498_009980 [Penicillium cinerascens]